MKPFLPLALTLPILLSACGGDNNSSSANPSQLENSPGTTPSTEQEVGKNLRMNLDLAKLKSAGVTADRIVVTITKSEFTKTIEVEHIDYSATAEFSNLALGEYQITVEIFDGETLVAEGTGTGTVSANQLATVDLRLELMSGGLAVNVCVPNTNTEGYYSQVLDMVVKNQVELNGLAAGFIGELAAGGAPKYKSSLAYTTVSVEDNINAKISLLNDFSSVDENTKTIEADENTLKISANGVDILSAEGCAQKYTLKLINTGILKIGGGLTVETVKHIHLITEIPVDGKDYIDVNGVVVNSAGNTSGNPYYRKVDNVKATIIFKPVSEGVVTSEAFKNPKLSELFDTLNFTHSLELHPSSSDGDFPVFKVSVGPIELPALGIVPLRADTQMAP